MEEIDITILEPVVEENVVDHVFELYTEAAPPNERGLGFLARSDTLSVSVCDQDLVIQQSLSSLSSETSSTGFVAWSSSVVFVEWLCKTFKLDVRAVELGAGVSGILALTVGIRAKQYLATDQRRVLKLLRRNIEENLEAEVLSKTLAVPQGRNMMPKPQIDVAEYDWEYASEMKDDILEYFGGECPDLVLASDTIYNEYLIRPFADACEALCGEKTAVITVLQLRDESIIESFLFEMLSRKFECFHFPPYMVSAELAKGYAVYYMRRQIYTSAFQ